MTDQDNNGDSKNTNAQNTNEIREKLKHELETVDWAALKPHLERDAIIVVSEELGLLDVAVHVAINDLFQVQQWIQQGRLTKPSPDQLNAWDADERRHFLFLIVQPYVLIQARPN